MSAASPFITVVMPVRNEARFIADTLEQLRGQDYPKDRFEILVADGMSDDGTREIVSRIAEEDGRVRLLDNPKKRSSAGRNVGFRAGQGDYFVVVDGHCHIPDDQFLRNISDCFEKSGAHCLGRPQPLDPPGLTPFQHSVALARASRLGHGGDSLIYGDYEGFASPVSNGAAYRREVFEKIGYVDEAFDACEDVEFNYRVEQAGLKSYTSPKLRVRYYPRENLFALLGQMRRYGRGRTRLYRKHASLLSLASMIPGCFVGGASVFVALLGLDVIFGLSAFPSFIFSVLGLVLSAYAVLVGMTSFLIGRANGWDHVWRVPVIFLAVHGGLGLGMWEELLMHEEKGIIFRGKKDLLNYKMLKKIIKSIVFYLIGQDRVLNYIEKRSDKKIIILMYHKINSDSDATGLSLKAEFFEKQLAYINNKYTIISLEEAVYRLESQNINENFVVLTFDDGFKDNLMEALPILKKYNAPATVFVACEAIEKGFTDWSMMDHAIFSRSEKMLDLSMFGLGRLPIETVDQKKDTSIVLRRQLKRARHTLRKDVVEFLSRTCKIPCARVMLTWDEVKQLAASGLVSIGAHTVTHPILSKLSYEDAHFEIAGSKNVIQQQTGVNAEHFAYPNGREVDFNEQTVSLVKNAGFKAACTTVSGVNRDGSDPFRLRRIDVTYGICVGLFGKFSPNMFGAYVSGEYKFLTGRE